jgi:hypothetical protein
VQLVDKENVTALITAEAIIVGLFVAYGSGIGGTIATLSKEGESIFGAVLAGLLISGLAITAFESIYLLYKSIRISPVDNERYTAGYRLFVTVLFGSGFYIAVNAFSILNFAMTNKNLQVPPEIQHMCVIIATSLLVGWSLLVLFTPVELTRYLRERHRYRWIPRPIPSIPGWVVIIVLAIITGGIEGAVAILAGVLAPPQLPAYSWFVWPILFVIATFLWIMFARNCRGLRSQAAEWAERHHIKRPSTG